MARLPAVDLGLMAEHLSSHQGAISKLRVYEHNVSLPELRKTLQLQRKIMEAHVNVMLQLINPNNTSYVEVPSLESLKKQITNNQSQSNGSNNKWITLEALSSAKSMSNRNFMSALMMQNKNVRDAHVKMAMQQLELMEKYERIAIEHNWTFTPMATYKEQMETYHAFKQ
ncbi:hypothetical protein [Ornithinibacillus sp. 179-J 7C1 HS]|uniref:hypothetical protein n=1 Tax=Ornithinibacillus sp. 179-J 7C1 HS TaxID=3142384 RepID=UPI0039A21973